MTGDVLERIQAMPQGLLLTGVVVSALLTLLFTVLSALLERSGHIRLRHWTENANASLQALWEQPSRFHAYRFVLSLAARLLPLVLLAALWAWGSHRSFAHGLWLAPLAVAILLLAVEWLNRYLVEVWAEESLRWLTPVYRLLRVLAAPILFVVAPLVSFVEDEDGDEASDDEDEASDDEIDAYIDVGRREGILEPEEEALVRSIVDFGDTQVRSIMTPRVEVNAASIDSSLEDLATKFFESKNSRLPLYRDSIDQVVGILHIRDLFEAMHDERDASPADLCQQPLYVPESKPLPVLLEELQERHQQMAIVVDEYGGVAGLVTVEDLVEEIVGDIRDEHEPRDIKEPIGDSRWRLSGRMYLEDLEEILPVDADVDELPYETISGLVCGVMGTVPAAGEVVERYGLRFVVEQADDRRVVQVIAGPIEPPDGATGGTDAAPAPEEPADAGVAGATGDARASERSA